MPRGDGVAIMPPVISINPKYIRWKEDSMNMRGRLIVLLMFGMITVFADLNRRLKASDPLGVLLYAFDEPAFPDKH